MSQKTDRAKEFTRKRVQAHRELKKLKNRYYFMSFSVDIAIKLYLSHIQTFCRAS